MKGHVANKSKVVQILPQDNKQGISITLRPGKADADTEFAFNKAHEEAILSPGCRRLLKCFGFFTDQGPKDQPYIRQTLLRYLEASEQERKNYDVLCAGSDLPHELKSLRNQCMFGSSAPPFGGWESLT